MLRVLHEVRPSRIGSQRLALFQNQFLEFLDAQIVNEELDPRAVAILFLAEPGEDSGYGLRERQNLFHRNKRVKEFRHVRDGAKSATDEHLKSPLLRSVLVPGAGDEADVVHVRQAASVLRASAERGLELPAEVLAVRVAQEKLRQRAGIGRDVEHLVLADSRIRARRHVADRIAAGLAGRNTGSRKTAHQARSVVDVNVVELKILPRGHVRDVVGVLLRQLRHGLELIRVEPSTGNLDPLHARSIPHRVRTLS